jgi:hypothetical protein
VYCAAASEKKQFMANIIRGSCLCGGVRFEVAPPFIRAGHCHCERCRKHSGTAVCTQARVKKEQFRLLQGENLIRVYGKGEGALKAFCVNCGSSLFGGDWPEASKFPFAWALSMTTPGFARSITRSLMIARRGTRSPMTCHGILDR